VIHEVVITPRAFKQLGRAPPNVGAKFLLWVRAVKVDGLEEVRRMPGYHDEPLRGRRTGQRSIRLNRSWRAIYTVGHSGAVEVARVEEITHHDY